MRFGSLFAGIGGFDLGLERAGMECAWQVEIDPWARKVLAKHWPDVPKYEDVKEVGHHNLEPVDVICGGFPCQDISNAGKRAGIEGERSGLWGEYSRIIRQLRPRYVIVENVAALLNRGLDVVLRDLAESGYDAEWDIISAAAVGAPHLRERVWIVAYPHSNGEMVQGRDRNRRDEEWHPQAQVQERGNIFSGAEFPGSRLAYAVSRGDRWSDWSCGWEREPAETLRHAGRRGGQKAWMLLPESELGRVVDGVSANVDRLRGLGNAVVPQVVEWIGRRILDNDQ
jgi:DNA (cytosine-5)-methyltransferase 1|tara:strand:+ start:1539 stop:2390 length:852 start_codon:yes stop_codon:yes gene_type:complete